MFVSGETADVAPETTSMIEGIVQQQVTEMVGGSSVLVVEVLTIHSLPERQPWLHVEVYAQ